MDMENDISCRWDRVEVYNCDSTLCDVLINVCGHSIPPAVVSSGNKAFIRFLSDDSFSRTGFAVEFEAMSIQQMGKYNNEIY